MIDESLAQATGESHRLESKDVAVPFGNHEVVVRLSPDGRFIGVVELRIRKDFLTPRQRVAHSGYLDVEEFYQD